jgi:t-SNARE complex subunit (syntaxin)
LQTPPNLLTSTLDDVLFDVDEDLEHASKAVAATKATRNNEAILVTIFFIVILEGKSRFFNLSQRP